MRHRQPAYSYQLRSKERTVHQGLLSRTAGTGLCPLRNFIGETLKIADKLKLPRVTLGVMIGKAVKLAEGHLDTHSQESDDEQGVHSGHSAPDRMQRKMY